MRRLLTILSLLGLLFLLAHDLVRAQGQEAEITDPADEATEVQIKPTITVKTHFPIDSSSITWERGCPDSAACVQTWPSVLVLPKLFSDSIIGHDTALMKIAVPGTYELVDDTTLTFTPLSDLGYGGTYVAKVKNLRVVVDTAVGPGAPDTLSVDETSISFTTVLPIHRVIAVNISPSTLMRCNDTIKMVFNRPLAADTSPTGPFIFLNHLDSVQFNSADSSGTLMTHGISVTTMLDTTGYLMHVLPSSLLPGHHDIPPVV